jgi:hypothetical protein
MRHFWTLSIAWDSLANIVPDNCLDDRRLRVPGGARDGFSILQRIQARFTQPPVQKVLGDYSGSVKLLAEIKNGWSSTSTPRMRLWRGG